MFKGSIPVNGSSRIISNVINVFTRGKRTKATNVVNASTQKIVNQLSALSASRKQPKLIRLCQEDLIKHQTIMNAWRVVQRRNEQKRNNQLKKQYQSIVNAMEDLKTSHPALYKFANYKPKDGTRFPLDLRMPTDFPPNKPWVYDYVPAETNEKRAKQ
ncbi:mitochondrial ribosomal protein L28-domain-containing protein [Scheffersomyces amazonensis]|uniref:mitochondrial ribosomal protein L28-domain-containing protein n=1 Tax=Scheffersomyces amazonensis TaxID=1078765 RepID=UPI00315D44F7